MNESDLLIVVGASFSNHTGIAPYKPIVQIDDDPAAIGRFHPVDVGVLGDAGVTLPRAARPARRRPTAVDQRADVAERWAIWRAEKARRASPTTAAAASRRPRSSPRCPQHCPADAVIAVDVGNHAYSFGRYFESRRASRC